MEFCYLGLLHGIYLSVHKVISNKFPQLSIHPFFKSRIGKIISILITQYFVFLAWIPFRVKDTDAMIYSMEKFLFFDFQTNGIISFLSSHKIIILLMLLFFILHYIMYLKPKTIEKIVNLKLRYWTIFLTGMMIAIIFFYNGNSEDFIYFRF